MGAIFRREMSAFFSSPIAYVYLAVFVVFSAFFFNMFCISYQIADMSGIFGNMFIIVIFLLPMLTMKLLSEDKKQKTDQCLLTAPVSLTGVVVGKYLAAFAVFLIGLLIFVVYAIILATFAPVQWASILGNILGLALLGGAFLSLGIFVSSLTENQIVAAIGGFIGMMLMYMIDSLVLAIPAGVVRDVATNLSFYSKYNEFASGIFNISNVIFFVSVAVVFNFLTVRVLEKRRWG